MDKLRLEQAALDAIGSVLRKRAAASGAEALAERKDLEPSVAQAVAAVVGREVESSREVGIPSWASVGQVDVVMRSPMDPGEFVGLIELKWCRPNHDVLYECV